MKHPEIVSGPLCRVAQSPQNNAKENHAEPWSDQLFKAMLRITASLPFKTALALVDVRVLDHLVVAGAEVRSFAESGLM